MMKLNNKGMTLVETVVTIVIISIASLILLTGFTSVTRYLNESNEIKNASDNLSKKIESETYGDLFTSKKDQAIKIKVNGNEYTSKVVMNVGSTEIDSNYKVQLFNFTQKVDTESIYQKLVENTYELAPMLSELTTKTLREESYNQFALDLGITPLTFPYGFNDQLRIYYYLKYCGNTVFPQLSDEIIDECNDIFDEQHKYATNYLEKNSRLSKDGDTYYMKMYYLPSIAENQIATSYQDAFIFYAETTSSNKQQNWSTKLIYNPDDKHWYYKVFETGVGDTGSKITLTNYSASSNVTWSNFKEQLNDSNEWIKLEHNE